MSHLSFGLSASSQGNKVVPMDDVLVHTPKEILDTEKGLPFVKGATAAHTRTQSQTPLFSPLKREIH